MTTEVTEKRVKLPKDGFFGAQNAYDKFYRGLPIGVTHRAAWREGPENSLLAIAASIGIGIDMTEIDVKKTKDGVLVLSHDTTIDRCTTKTGNISDFTWEELTKIPVKAEEGKDTNSDLYVLTEKDAALLNGLPHYCEHSGVAQAGGTIPLARLDDALDLIKKVGPKTLINFDHCFTAELFADCYMMFREYGMLDITFFKNPFDAEAMMKWYAVAAEKWNEKHVGEQITAEEVRKSTLYVYIANWYDVSVPRAHFETNENLAMVEIVIPDDDAEKIARAELEPWCIENNVAMFVNTMWSGLCSTRPDTEATWAEMISRGYKAIQTDHPRELVKFLAEYNDRSK
mgnify:CR=1 FL=1